MGGLASFRTLRRITPNSEQWTLEEPPGPRELQGTNSEWFSWRGSVFPSVKNAEVSHTYFRIHLKQIK
jgi:hypothetical protein